MGQNLSGQPGKFDPAAPATEGATRAISAGYEVGMGAHHDHGPGHSHGAPSSLLTKALWITLIYMAVEVAGGLWTGSLALLADAAHMLSDAGALAIALAAARISERPPDSRQTMGYARAEVMGAGVNAAALAILGVWVGVEGIQRLFTHPQVIAGPMMVVAGIGLAVNLGIARMLFSQAHNLNTRAALLHVLGDALGSVGALTAGALILWKGWFWADAAASLFIACILLFGGVRMLREVSGVLMQAAPRGVDVAALDAVIGATPGVQSVHDLHVWSLRPGRDVLTVHVVLADVRDAVDVCSAVRSRLQEELPSAHVTVQAEPEGTCCG
jgi:cobalt-zinc-cadmium efflux system protein